MDEFVAVWARDVVPLRRRFGFTVLGAWRSDDADRFTWVIGAETGDFAAMDAAYYESPERAALPVDPASFLEQVDVEMMDDVVVTPEG